MSNSQTQLTFPNGVYTVLVTPFVKGDENTIKWSDLDKVIEWQIQCNVAGFVILGTTSEAPTLTECEKKQMVQYVHNKVGGRKPIVTGVGGNYTQATLEFAKFAAPYSDGLMVTVPHYNKPQQRGIIRHFITIASDPSIKSKPIIIYNIPGRTCVNMIPESVVEVLNLCPNVVAIKEASGDFNQVSDLISLVSTNTNRKVGDTFKVFAGDDSSVMEVSKMMGSGVISVGSNVIPDFMVKLTDMCLNGKYEECNDMMNSLIDFTRILFIETNPVPVKYLLHGLNLYESDAVRAPLASFEDDIIKKMVQNEFTKIAPTVKLSFVTHVEDTDIVETEKEKMDEEAMNSFYSV